jgi:DnaJ-class molecular chaperone
MHARTIESLHYPKDAEDSKDLHPWWDTETRVTFEGEDEKQVGEAVQDAAFGREGEHPICEPDVRLIDALSRYELKLTDFEGNVHRKTINEVIQPARRYRIKDAGMLRKDGTRGDIIVRFRVQFPANLTSDICLQLRRTLPAS